MLTRQIEIHKSIHSATLRHTPPHSTKLLIMFYFGCMQDDTIYCGVLDLIGTLRHLEALNPFWGSSEFYESNNRSGFGVTLKLGLDENDSSFQINGTFFASSFENQTDKYCNAFVARVPLIKIFGYVLQSWGVLARAIPRTDRIFLLYLAGHLSLI